VIETQRKRLEKADECKARSRSLFNELIEKVSWCLGEKRDGKRVEDKAQSFSFSSLQPQSSPPSLCDILE
jgi:hypothetical protein